MEHINHIDVLIIGAGPIGISCGLEATKLGISSKIVDKGCLVNSIHDFPDDMTFFSSADKLEIGDIPFTCLNRRPHKREALEYYRHVAKHYDLNVGLYENIETVSELEGEAFKFLVKTSKTEYYCNFIINATGFYDIPVLLNIPGEELNKVKHYFTSAHHLYKQKVVVIGASNSAIDVAMEAYRKDAEVTVVVRNTEISDSVKYWIKPDFEARVKEGHIKVLYESTLISVSERSVKVKHKKEEIELENDFVFAMTGYKPNFKLIEHLGININDSFVPEYNENTMETNASGIYLAGVVCGGMNTKELYIENSRDHGIKIMTHIKNQKNTL